MNVQAAKTGARIAICEDERIIALNIEGFLSRNGYQVFGVYEAAEDLLAALEADQPDLALMDIHLQGKMDGIEAAAVLNEGYGIPVILLTAYADAPTIERAKLSQPFGYVLKPYDDRELRTAIEIGAYRSVMEKRLRSSEARYRRLFEGGMAALFLTGDDGTILQANPAFAALGGNAESLANVFKSPELSRSMLSRLAEGESISAESCELFPGLDGERWALVSAAGVSMPDGQNAYMFQAFDITERKRLQDSLVGAQKMEALGRLAGGAAHDFNNIITAIVGYTRLATNSLGPDAPIKTELEGIEAAAKRASNLARQLLTFSRGDRADPVCFSLGTMLTDMARMLEQLLGAEYSLVLHEAQTPHDHVLADRGRMEQVLVNLVINARDAMQNGGKVILLSGLRETTQTEATDLGAMPPGSWSFFSVKDEGSGI